MKVGLLHARTGVAGIWAPSMDAAATLGAAEIKLGCSTDEYMELIRGYNDDPVA